MGIITIEQTEKDSILQQLAKPVEFPLNEADKALIAAMKTKLLALGGVGLAAPQINQSKQIVVVYIPESAALLRDNVTPYPMHVLLNPNYHPTDERKAADFEACYSVSSKAGKVPRYTRIALTYFDEQGQIHQQIEEGFYARVLQHEIDHLQGTLIIDRLTVDCVQGSMEEMMKLRRAELSDEKKILFDALIQQKNSAQ